MNRIRWSNAVLKNIAYLTMLTDHFFAIIFIRILRQCSAAGQNTELLDGIYSAGRAVGRISFVLFCFLIVEGFVHTRSRRDYLLRLGIFALVSEVPFDLAFSGKIMDPGSQNVYFTLFLGVLVLCVWEWAAAGVRRLRRRPVREELWWILCIMTFRAVQFGALILGCITAYAIKTDYKYMGVLLIWVLYLSRDMVRMPERLAQIVLAGCVMMLGMWSINYMRYADVYSSAYLFQFSMRELYGLSAFVPILLYDGSKGRQMPKAVCYGFYPVHLFVLYVIAAAAFGQ